MTHTIKPEVGDWYKNANGDEFEVVAIDEEDGNIEIQYFDGTIEEIDFDNWYEIEMVAIEAPEDWSGSYDMEREDYGVDLDTPRSFDRSNPLDDIER